MQTWILLCFALLGSAVTLLGAECDSTSIRFVTAKDQLTIFNDSGKSIVAYVLASTEPKSKDGSPARTYSGVFTGQKTLAPGSSIEVGQGSRSVTVDYIRFADGSTCGNAITEQAKTIAARFGKK
jgi:hypothetical protein